MPTNDTMILDIKNNTDPQDTISTLQTWMMYVSGVSISYSMVNVTMAVKSSKYSQVMAQIPQGEVVITNVTGPSVDNNQTITSLMPNKSNIVLFCGFDWYGNRSFWNVYRQYPRCVSKDEKKDITNLKNK